MRRREFITLLGGAGVVWPLPARAQQSAMQVVGFLRSATLSDTPHLVTAFRQGLKEEGFIEGQNVAIEFRSGESQNDRLPTLAADLIRWPVVVIVGDTISALAAKAVTSTVPIIFAGGGDPVAQGLVASMNRPGGNVTGVSFFGGVLGAKRLELLRLLVPKATTIAMLVSPDAPTTEAERRDVQAAAETMGQRIIVVDVDSDRDLFPGISCVLYADTHTPGSQCIYVQTVKGTAAIVGDIARKVDLNVRQAIPPGIYYDLEKMRRALADIARRAKIILPAHDWDTLVQGKIG